MKGRVRTKNNFTLFLIVVFNCFWAYCGTTPFVTTWETTNEGVSNNNQITIPTHPDEIYNYTVFWGDGTSDINVTGNITHTYATEGQYQVEITGVFPRIYFNNEGDASKILSINAWGDNKWISMGNAFDGCNFLVGRYTDNPDLSLVTDMSAMFRLAVNFNSAVNNWDVSTVTNMSQLFENATSFNQPLDNWNVSMVTDMSFMFNNFNEGTITEVRDPIPGTTFFNLTREVSVTAAFNQDISNWNVENVTNMVSMFSATPFNQNIDNWNVANVEDMSAMFYVAVNFNQNLNNWNVGNVTQMPLMFGDANLFNSNISNWNVSAVTNMQGMFLHALSFNQDISDWNVAAVTDMSFMFGNTQVFNADITNWNVGNVTDMTGMFINTVAFNQPIGNWNVANVTNMTGMFFDAMVFNQNINNWDVSMVQEFRGMFAYAVAFDNPLDNWDIGLATDLSFMFFEATNFNQNIGNWDVSNLLDATQMFQGVMLSVENYDALLIGWEANIVELNVNFDGGLSQFCAGEEARDRLIEFNNWNITDNGKVSFNVNVPSSQIEEYAFTFPEIIGEGLTGNQAYYLETGGAGIAYTTGDQLLYDEGLTYPITIYIFDQTNATPVCQTEQEFELTLTRCGSNFEPNIADVTTVEVLHSYEFPNISGSNFSGNQAYYLEPGGFGTRYSEGDLVFFEDFSNYPVTIYVYDELDSGFGYTCDSEKQFFLTITETLPNCTNLISPANGDSDVTLNLQTIEWESVDNARGYEVSIGTSPNGNELLNAETVKEHFLNLTFDLPQASEIYVNIIPFNGLGRRSSGCVLQSFTTEIDIEIPPFFTPNGDNINDTFLLPNPLDTFKSVFVFDRFGKLLFQTMNPNIGWDGEFQGKVMPVGDYWYMVSYNTGKIYKGNVTLKR